MSSVSHLAIYPGTFDPVHLGHLNIVRRVAAQFDEVLVAVVRDRPAKPLMFTTAERVALFQESIADVANVRVESYTGLTVDFAREQRATCIVRGLRGTSDFDFELQLATMNHHLLPTVDTVFLMAATEHLHLSSSLIKEVVTQGGSTDGLVTSAVASALKAKLSGRAG